MSTHDTSHHEIRRTHEDVIGSERNASASSVDDHAMDLNTRRSIQPGEEAGKYMPRTIDHEREDFDEDHMHGAPC
ncbi:MAG: hypothetical protein KGI03_00900 [Patescibacteria group bacterium]|nr:hypothetical protein [Patescibacteria group bacterium]